MKAHKLFAVVPLVCLSALSLLLMGAKEAPNVTIGTTPIGSNPEKGARPHPLVWDAMEKTTYVKAGDTNAAFSFWVTNTAKGPVLISSVKPSCGCTVADYPKPWNLGPGESGEVKANMNIAGKTGTQVKILTVISSGGL